MDGVRESEVTMLRVDMEVLADLQDAATLIKRLVHRVIKDNPALPYPPIVAQAKGWLERKGLQGSPLRKGKK